MGWQDAPEVGSGWASAPVVDKPEPVRDFSGNLRIGPLDTGIPLPQFINRGLAQFGSGVADWGLGARQIAGSATAQDAKEKAILDSQLNDSLTGKVLNFAGNAAPALAIPTVAGAPVLSGVVAGGVTGLMQPVQEGESRAFNTTVGSVLGGAVPGVVKAFKGAANGQADDLARRAVEQYNIPLTVNDITSSKLLKGANSLASDLPFSGSVIAAQNEAKQAAFNQAVGKTFGADAAKLTPDVMNSAQKRMGAEFDRVWGRNQLVVDNDLTSKISSLWQEVQKMPKSEGDALAAQLKDLASKVTQDQNGRLIINGESANKFQQYLRKKAESGGDLGNQLNDLRQAIIKSFNNSVSPADAASLTLNRQQYRAFKTVDPILNKAEAGVAGRTAGDVPAALLPGQVVQQYGSHISSSPFADLSAIGGRFLVDRTPQTGGSSRALIQNTLAGLGGVGGFTLGGPAGSAAGAVGSIAGAGLLGRATQAAMGPAAARSILLNQAPQGLIGNAAQQGLYRMPVPIGLGLLNFSPSLE